MTSKRFRQSIALMLRFHRNAAKIAYLRKNSIFQSIGENCTFGPVLVPLYPELISLHNNVFIHRSAKLITHDTVNAFLRRSNPDYDYGGIERIAPIEIMDNCYIAFGAVVMPGVRIGPNAIVSANSVVISDVPPGCVVQGNPAKVVGRFELYTAIRLRECPLPTIKNQAITQEDIDRTWRDFRQKYDSRG